MGEKPVLGYWKVRGFAHSIRFLLKYLNVEFEDKYYGFSSPPDDYRKEWRETHRPTLQLDFPNIPYWIDGEVRMTESIPILRQIARKYGKELVPSDSSTQWRVEMVESYIVDILISLHRLMYFYNDQLYQDFLKEQLPKFQKLQEFIGDNKWLLGSNLTYLDFLLYETLYQHTVLKADIFQDLPRLTQHISEFEALPAISNYLSSPDFLKGPVITPGAKLKI
ncbi:unnamed protein product [Allacma fusca]|uniref:glutathione transferase n=2 Tax=Allacma fusca TaxID=39272 RepID=A0A8J2PNZ5_9HEXA|nr:unnamed protein product [Allacma fusca]